MSSLAALFPSFTQNKSDFSQLFFKSQPIEKQGFARKGYGVTAVEDTPVDEELQMFKNMKKKLLVDLLT